MNKSFSLLLGMSLSCAVFGAANDMVVSFSTPGVDRYTDDTTVLDGESYALIWTAKNATFGGISAGCKPISETDRIVLVAPLAKQGKCPVTVFEIPAAEAVRYLDGSFSLYLLDTRVKGADGKITLAEYRGGLPSVVNSLGLSDASGQTSASGVAGRISATSAIALGSVGVYTKIDSPVITAIKAEGAIIRLEVKGVSAAADYFVVPGNTPSRFASAMDAKLEAQSDSETASITFDKPTDETTFYKVIGVRKF